MNRRTLIKNIFASAAIFPLLSFNNINNSSKKVNNSFIKLKYGELDIYIFSDGYNILKDPYPLIGPKSSIENFNLSRQETFLDQQEIAFSYNIFLIKNKDRYILFDTGNGSFGNENNGKLFDQLNDANISLDLITDVIITHAHGDHINGIINSEGELNFKNATYYISKTEYDFWINGNNINTVKILNKIKSKIKFVVNNQILFDFIKVEETPGHTPGHLAFSIFQDNKKIKIKHIADVVHSPILINNPTLGIKFDNDFELAIKTRIRILEEAYENKELIFAMHLPWPGLGYIGKNGKNNYQWIPISFGSNLQEIEL